MSIIEAFCNGIREVRYDCTTNYDLYPSRVGIAYEIGRRLAAKVLGIRQ